MSTTANVGTGSPLIIKVPKAATISLSEQSQGNLPAGVKTHVLPACEDPTPDMIDLVREWTGAGVTTEQEHYGQKMHFALMWDDITLAEYYELCAIFNQIRTDSSARWYFAPFSSHPWNCCEIVVKSEGQEAKYNLDYYEGGHIFEIELESKGTVRPFIYETPLSVFNDATFNYDAGDMVLHYALKAFPEDFTNYLNGETPLGWTFGSAPAVYRTATERARLRFAAGQAAISKQRDLGGIVAQGAFMANTSSVIEFCFRYADTSNYYCMQVDQGAGTIRLQRHLAGNTSNLDSVTGLTIPKSRWFGMRVSANGSSLIAQYIPDLRNPGGYSTLRATDTGLASGKIGFRATNKSFDLTEIDCTALDGGNPYYDENDKICYFANAPDLEFDTGDPTIVAVTGG